MLYIANWKAYFSYHQSQQWLDHYQAKLMALALQNQIILCPSASFLPVAAQRLQGSGIALAAQDCAPVASGPYTGQEALQTLIDLNIRYCLVGHSERRASGESDAVIAQKVSALISAGITPILCVGEQDKKRRSTILEQQLQSALNSVASPTTIFIAYEPVWAIGTASSAPPDYIEESLAMIRSTLQNYPHIKVQLLYGGSVAGNSAGVLKKITGLDGLLIGKASLDFDALQAIVMA